MWGTSDARCDEAGRAFLKVADPFARVPPICRQRESSLPRQAGRCRMQGLMQCFGRAPIEAINTRSLPMRLRGSEHLSKYTTVGVVLELAAVINVVVHRIIDSILTAGSLLFAR